MKFARNAKPFTGQLDVAPFAGVFFLLILFLVLNSSLVPPPGIAKCLAADGCDIAVCDVHEEQAIAAARPLHPTTLPCFLILPIEGGNADYLAWARAQTGL